MASEIAQGISLQPGTDRLAMLFFPQLLAFCCLGPLTPTQDLCGSGLSLPKRQRNYAPYAVRRRLRKPISQRIQGAAQPESIPRI